MKKILAVLLCGVLLLSMAGCRRRITAENGDVVYETVYQPTPVPMESQGQQIPSGPADGEDTKVEYDPNGKPVDETTPAQGGETVPNVPDPEDPGKKVTVTLDAMGGQCSKETVTVQVGGVYGELPTPTKTGQNFMGWFRDAEGGESVDAVSIVTTETDHTLYAHWTTKTEFILTFDPNGGRISPYSAEKKIYSGAVYGELPKPVREGYAFLGWYTQPEGGQQLQSTDMVTVIDDQTVYAHWEYDPYAYWSYVLENTTQKVFTCQQAYVYLELKADNTTMLYAPLISDTGSINIAGKESSAVVTDEWVKSKKPNVVIKLTDHTGSAKATKAAMQKRFPNAKILVMPIAAAEGSDAEQLYYKLRLAAICYPEWYDSLDMDTIAQELGVTDNLYS